MSMDMTVPCDNGLINIRVAKPENGPVPLRQQKRMMTLEDSMRSQLPNEFTNMFKKMNGWDVDNT